MGSTHWRCSKSLLMLRRRNSKTVRTPERRGLFLWKNKKVFSEWSKVKTACIENIYYKEMCDYLPVFIILFRFIWDRRVWVSSKTISFGLFASICIQNRWYQTTTKISINKILILYWTKKVRRKQNSPLPWS